MRTWPRGEKPRARNDAVPPMQPIPSLDDLAVFVDIVAAGSLAAAARLQSVPKSTLSRRLGALERSLGERLVQRNSRRLALTEAGERFHADALPLVEQARALRRRWQAPDAMHGRLRVTATAAFGVRFVTPVLADFASRHPGVRAELHLSDRPLDLIGEGLDVAVRMGRLQDSALVHRKLADISRVLVGAPALLERVGLPQSLEHLTGLPRIGVPKGNPWTFGADAHLAPAGTVAFVANQLAASRAAALQGMGIAILPRYLVQEDMDAGRLHELLPTLAPTPSTAHAVWPSNEFLPRHVRAFIDVLAASMTPHDLRESAP